MNIALEQTEEHVNGVVTNRYGDAFIRGNNGMSMFIWCEEIMILFIPPEQSSTSLLRKNYKRMFIHLPFVPMRTSLRGDACEASKPPHQRAGLIYMKGHIAYVWTSRCSPIHALFGLHLEPPWRGTIHTYGSKKIDSILSHISQMYMYCISHVGLYTILNLTNATIWYNAIYDIIVLFEPWRYFQYPWVRPSTDHDRRKGINSNQQLICGNWL